MKLCGFKRYRRKGRYFGDYNAKNKVDYQTIFKNFELNLQITLWMFVILCAVKPVRHFKIPKFYFLKWLNFLFTKTIKFKLYRIRLRISFKRLLEEQKM